MLCDLQHAHRFCSENLHTLWTSEYIKCFSLASNAAKENQWLVLMISINILKCHSCTLWRYLLLRFIFESLFQKGCLFQHYSTRIASDVSALHLKIPIETCIFSFWPVNGKLHLFSEPNIIQCGQLFLKCSFYSVLKVLSFPWTACCYTPISPRKGKVCDQYHTRVVPMDQVYLIEVLFPCSRKKNLPAQPDWLTTTTVTHLFSEAGYWLCSASWVSEIKWRTKYKYQFYFIFFLECFYYIWSIMAIFCLLIIIWV